MLTDGRTDGRTDEQTDGNLHALVAHAKAGATIKLTNVRFYIEGFFLSFLSLIVICLNEQSYEKLLDTNYPQPIALSFITTILWHLSRLMSKPTQWHVRPAKTQISLGIRSVWSESSLSAWRKLGSLATHWAHSEDSDQTGRMHRLIWVFAGRTCHYVGFVVWWLICNIWW